MSGRIYIHNWANTFIIISTRKMSGRILSQLNIVQGSECMVFSIEMHISKAWNNSSLFEHRHWLYVERILDFSKNHTRTPSKRNAMALFQLEIVECFKYIVFSTETHLTKTRNRVLLFDHRCGLHVERILDFGKNHARTRSKRNAMAPAQLNILEGLKHMVFSTEK